MSRSQDLKLGLLVDALAFILGELRQVLVDSNKGADCAKDSNPLLVDSSRAEEACHSWKVKNAFDDINLPLLDLLSEFLDLLFLINKVLTNEIQYWIELSLILIEALKR